MTDIEHAGFGAAWLRSHPDTPIGHRDGEPCATCDGVPFLANVRRSYARPEDMSPVTPGPVRRVPQPLAAGWSRAGGYALAGLTFGGGLVLGMIVGGMPK